MSARSRSEPWWGPRRRPEPPPARVWNLTELLTKTAIDEQLKKAEQEHQRWIAHLVWQ